MALYTAPHASSSSSYIPKPHKSSSLASSTTFSEDDLPAWTESSPISSEDSTSGEEEERETSPDLDQTSPTMEAHSPPSPPTSLPAPAKLQHHARSYPHPRTLVPLTTSRPVPNLPKAQPLSRALFARKANDIPHAGMVAGGAAGKKKGTQKIIVPSKGFRTTFALDLTANEFARKA
ncbi:hypothetical protein BCR39DRAFT_521020 [Naematelia encephala]|uniref:Uncharacterized protein n=1 Tax=Naematelia encephala TaxID=71784 RepID=A0A1Y2BE23_9TREE|nr:hypothetical protein BCR39DRAFT_521020 [Naematelia encephala]